ncbi:membrane protein [Dictyobacter alpinus]|uniref:Membrane protein n=1 Tax=Dictyobacter alpinus TaxID=2014873 RepID=A0A402B157_9CHLR|nr:SDR family oxidoreductase [Dictyobacter alpinus]GCE25072.1 membrane protein [Dictyobacter alpinus]
MSAANNSLHVIFGTGPVGRAVMQELLVKGKRIRMVNHSGKADIPVGVEILGGDASDAYVAIELSRGAEVIYNCTNVNYTKWPELFPPLQQGIMAGARATGARLVAMENVYMYGPTGGKPLTEDLPYVATTRKGRTRARMSEELLAAHKRGDIRVAIGRAADFFGPNVLESALGERVFGPILMGKAAQVVGNPDLLHSYTYALDIGKALVILGERDEALGQAWHIPSPPAGTTRAIIELIARESGQQARIQALPSLLLQMLGLFNPTMREVSEMRYQFDEPFILDASRFEQTFGMHATPLPQAIQATLKWFRHRVEKTLEQPEKGAEKKEADQPKSTLSL